MYRLARKMASFFLSLCMLFSAPAAIISTAASYVGESETKCIPADMNGIAGIQAHNDTYGSSSLSIDDIKEQPPLKLSFDNDFIPASPRWMELVAGEEPASFKATYILEDNVIQVNKTVTQSVADMGQVLSGSTIQKLHPRRIIENGGYIDRTVLDAAAAQDGREIENGSVVVDEETGTAFKVVSPTIYSGIFDADPELSEMVKPLENTYSIAKPELHEVVKDFDLPEQTVTLNRANITEFAPNVEGSFKPYYNAAPLAVGDEDKIFKTLTGDNLIELSFKDAPLQGRVGNSTINVKLSGGIAVDRIDVTGRYSCMGGYEISMKMRQECYLVAELDAEVNEEIRVPILGITIPFGVGEVYGGIYAIIGMNGQIRLGIEARETNSCKVGIEGGTFLYVPTSFHPLFEPTPPQITGDCDMLGKINGYIKFGPMLGIELFGFDLVGAGVLLGAGVNVQSDGSILDIELYASIDVYIELADEYFSLLRARPTIYNRQQADLHGYKVSFLETYVNPGRVGGLIEEEPYESGAAYVPSVGLEYRIWVVPRASVDTFDPAKREAILSADRSNNQKALKDKVRTYSEDKFDKTNDEGEFIQKDDEICYSGDQVYLEFKGDGTTLFVGPSTPVLPFTDITITYADYFNDYITGKVEPERIIRWESNRFNPDEEQQELAYYQGPIYISPFNDYGIDRHAMATATQNHASYHRPYIINGTARTDTNALGEFDSRNPYLEGGTMHPSGTIDVLSEDTLDMYISGDTPPSTIGVLVSLDLHDEVKDITVYGVMPAAPEFQFNRTINFVEGSYKRIIDGGKIIDRMAYDEYLWISNPVGTRAITADMLEYKVKGFSTQDYKGYYENPVTETREGPITLTPVMDENGNPTGTALFAQRVTVEWVWQEHPNPIKITSQDHTESIAGEESSFQVTADGFFPKFSLKGEPQRVWIDAKTGFLYVPQTLDPGEYTFTIHVEEGSVLTMIGAPDPKKGNDSSPPDEQTFTLTVTPKAPEQEPSQPPSQTPEPSPPATPTVTPASPTPGPDIKTAPVIFKDEYNIFFAMDSSKDLVIPFKATGSEPITWSLTAAGNYAVPGEITINEETGVVTIKKSIAAGVYSLKVKAANDAGFDTHEFTLKVESPKAPPKVSGEDYLAMTSGTENLTAIFTASGTQPIVFSVISQSITGSPVPHISINANTGLLTVSKDIPAGKYSIEVTATNAVGSDTFECVLEVKAPGTPPVFANRRDSYNFKMSSAETEFSVQLKASGSEPIIYSLEPVSTTLPVPSEISIDASTGLLTVKGGTIGGINAGVYRFIVKASNNVGSDTQECVLEVTAAILPSIRPGRPMMNVPGDGSPAFIELAVSNKPGESQVKPPAVLNQDLFRTETPPNTLTIRCDDPKDVYTHDRDVYNGASFIRWDSSVVLSIIDVMVDTSIAKVESDYTYYDVVSWGDQLEIKDNSPVCDRYHYYDPKFENPKFPLTEEETAKMKANIKKSMDDRISEYKNGYKDVNLDFSAGGLRDRYYGFVVNPTERIVTGLEYGSLIDAMNKKKGGAFNVELNLETGTVITGKYFTTMMVYPDSSITFKQNGADITFIGKDLTKTNNLGMFNIGFTAAPHEAAMLESIGPGFESFTFGFQHHGELPGLATFAVTTAISEGTKVNVYRFDAATNEFALIAENLNVGANGVVTYKNNTMSEYVITTKTISEATVTCLAVQQDIAPRNGGWLIGAGIAVLLAGAVIMILVLKRKQAGH
jgi:hypothetical protein